MIDFKTNGESPKILLIDDNAGEVIILKNALKSISINNIEYEAYQNPLEAISYLENLVSTKEGLKNLPNLIFLDLNMPEMNGSDVLVILKKIKALKTIPIVIMTTSSIETELKNCYMLHANSVMQKPMDFDDYIEMLDVTTRYWFYHSSNIK